MAERDESSLDRSALDVVHAYWRGWAQRDPEPGFVSIVRLGAVRFLTAPDELRAHIESADPVTADDLVRVLGHRAVVRSGEARLAYTDARSLRPQPSSRTVRIGTGDARIARLGDSADPDEWNESMSHDDWAHIVGVVEGTELVAVAAYQVWDDALAHVGVFTAAHARSRGLSTELASTTVEHALEEGLVPQWRVRVGNDASWRVAQKLGFVGMGRQIFAALRVER